MSYAILIIEDETTLARNMKTYLERYGYEVRIAQSAEEGFQQLDSFKPDVILLDLQLPGMSGLDALARIKERDAQVKIVIITAHGNIETAVDAMKAGAYDFMNKPLVLAKLKVLLDKAVGQTKLEGTLSYYREKEAGESTLSALIGKSPPMRSLKNRIEQIIDSERKLTEGDPPAVLITGETGTGKELAARALHYNGPRKNGPFIEINCASIPTQLLEAELFGYERGAFTDAKEKKIGLFQAAEGGTLFLDEIGEIEISLQAKLLKALEDKVIRRIGNIREQKVDVRIITATNQSLEESVRQGRFRPDLFFRLRIIHLELPPLRSRGSDILPLANHFLKIHSRRYGKQGMRFSPEAEKALLDYSWPGNVRELRNMIEQTVLLSKQETIEPDQLALLPGLVKIHKDQDKESEGRFLLPPQGISLEEVERDLVLQALKQTSWNVTHAAKLLGLTRDTLRYRMDKYKLEPLF
ncbi:sigma-54-dependent transcriptional regulator [Candidatus Manganitrophus noduliformans]|uniref:Sigma-54-dependent Fis family transcriptional regulator n=1 Tax=Candidatus Manganitrophus noduliformans TaxID=2606439 RepID=A0A7X6IDY3_9BACT|nr:sigma-54 dependent transcriptional regulator [Candidatus Manganitrophus noduliformans]NKE73735.1 sigma-54-dependent Fis family transcriptional regulator [Candidatus Manganitrophus noduliformans]